MTLDGATKLVIALMSCPFCQESIIDRSIAGGTGKRVSFPLCKGGGL